MKKILFTTCIIYLFCCVSAFAKPRYNKINYKKRNSVQKLKKKTRKRPSKRRRKKPSAYERIQPAAKKARQRSPRIQYESAVLYLIKGAFGAKNICVKKCPPFLYEK